MKIPRGFIAYSGDEISFEIVVYKKLPETLCWHPLFTIMPSTAALKEKICSISSKSANSVNCFIRWLPCLMGIIVMVFSLSISFDRITISFGGLIIGFYMLAGGFVFFLIEKKNEKLFECFPSLNTGFGKGVFYIIVGTLPFTVTGINDLLGIFLFLTGIVIILRGAYIIFKDRRGGDEELGSKYFPVELIVQEELKEGTELETKNEPAESLSDSAEEPLDV